MPEQNRPLRRYPALIPLSREHHKLLVLAQLLKSDVPNYKGLPDTLEGKWNYTVSLSQNIMLRHFQQEEAQLLPFGKSYSELEPLLVQMQAEHTAILAAFAKCERELTATQLDVLGRLIEQHVRFEERQLFGLIQAHLTDDELATLNF
ncbi:MAG: hemerythrin domain-containing protein [Bacteroidota bacterium]